MKNFNSFRTIIKNQITLCISLTLLMVMTFCTVNAQLVNIPVTCAQKVNQRDVV